MSDSEFKIVNDDKIIENNTLDNDNAMKNCEDFDNNTTDITISDDETNIEIQKQLSIFIDDNIYCFVNHGIDIMDKLMTVARKIASDNLSSESTINIHKKDKDVIMTIRYHNYVMSQESLYHKISYKYIDNFDNLFKDV